MGGIGLMGYPFQGTGGGGTSWSEYTQTYSTADATHAARTSAALTDNSGGSAGATLAAVTAPNVDSGVDTVNIGSTQTNLNTAWGVLADAIASLNAEIDKLRADQIDTAQIVNKLIDDTQA